MMRFKLIIFDLDGTLINGWIGLKECLNYCLEKVSAKTVSWKKFTELSGMPLQVAFKYLLPEITERKAVELVDLFKKSYQRFYMNGTKLLPGVKTVLKEFERKEICLAVATTKPTSMAEKILKKLNALNYFDAVIGSPEIGNDWSKERQLKEVFKKIKVKVKKTEALMVGDSAFDVRGANKLGLRCVCLENKFVSKKELRNAGAWKTVKRFKDLTKEIN